MLKLPKEEKSVEPFPIARGDISKYVAQLRPWGDGFIPYRSVWEDLSEESCDFREWLEDWWSCVFTGEPPTVWPMTPVPLELLRVDHLQNTQHWDENDDQVVIEYIDAMAAGDVFPPIVVTVAPHLTRRDWYIFDGNHRYAAYRTRGKLWTWAMLLEVTAPGGLMGRRHQPNILYF